MELKQLALGTDLLQAKAKPITSCGSTSGTMSLKKEGKVLHNSNVSQRQEGEHGRETAVRTPRSVKGDEGLKEPTQSPTCSPWRSPCQSRGMPEECCDPWQAHSWQEP